MHIGREEVCNSLRNRRHELRLERNHATMARQHREDLSFVIKHGTRVGGPEMGDHLQMESTNASCQMSWVPQRSAAVLLLLKPYEGNEFDCFRCDGVVWLQHWFVQ